MIEHSKSVEMLQKSNLELLESGKNAKEMYESQVQSHSLQIRDLEGANEDLKRKLAEITSAHDVKLTSVENLSILMNEKEVEIANRKRENIEMQSQITSMSNEVENLKSLNKSLTQEVDSLNTREKALLEKINSISSELTQEESGKELLTAELARVKYELQQLHVQFDEEKEARDLAMKLAEQRELELERASNELATLRQINDESENKHSVEISMFNDKLDRIQVENAELLQRILTLEGSLSRAEKSLVEMSRSCDSLKCEVSEKTDELLKLHDMLESSDGKLKKAVEERNDLEDELFSKVSILEKSVENMEFEKQELASKIEEIDELKKLLIDANENVVEARKHASDLDDELQKALSQLNEKEHELAEVRLQQEHFEASSESDVAVVQELRAKLLASEEELQKIRNQHNNSVQEMKNDFLTEKEKLLEDAENAMDGYRKEIKHLQLNLKQSESEAYLSRQATDNLRDEIAEKDRSITVFKGKIADLEAENSRVKTKLQRSDSASDTRIISLTADLRKARAETSANQNRIAAYQQQIEELEASRKRTSVLHDEKMALIDSLNRKITSLERRLSVAGSSIVDDEKVKQLEAEVEQLKKKIDSKNKRIEKLNSAKLTREQLDSIKKLKEDHRRAIETIASLKKSQEEFPIQPSDVEISKMKFDKDALESKLRKFASHCQHLEDERADILRALGSRKRSSDDKDIVRCIVNICDRITTLEEECSVLSKSEQHSSHLVEQRLKDLEEQNRKMETDLQRSQERYDKILHQHQAIQKELFTANQLKEDMINEVKSLKSKSSSTLDEKTRQVRFLEQENLKLMIDLKSAKKQLQSLKSEVNAMKSGIVDGCFQSELTSNGHTKGPLKEAPNATPVFPRTNPPSSNKKSTSITLDKENSTSENILQSSSVSKRPPIGGSSRKVQSLGEAFNDGDENTQECKQS